MIIYEVIPEKEELKHYDRANFYLAKTVKGYVISVESPTFGYIPKHPDIKTPARLFAHLEKMKADGFTVKKHTFDVE